ncbi:MAG: hypothetical protein NVV68_17915 [Dokdonella sp.]|nr:hypothetical protein [Dokdonella sp.]
MIDSSAAAGLLLDNIRWIDSVKENKQFFGLPGSNRNLLGAASTDLAIEYASAILRLAHAPRDQQAMCGAAMTLLRPMFEVLANAWLIFFVLDEAQVERLANGGRIPNWSMAQRVDRIERTVGMRNDNFMSRVMSPELGLWRMLNGFTHGGFEQLRRRIARNVIGPVYTDEDLARAMVFAALLAIIGWSVICREANRHGDYAEGERRLNHIAALLNESGERIRMGAS